MSFLSTTYNMFQVFDSLPLPLPLPEPFPEPFRPWGSLVSESVCFHFHKPLPSVLVRHTSCTSHLCTNSVFHDVVGFHNSGILHLSTQHRCPLVVVTVGDRLWRAIFRPESECLAMPSVLSTSSGSQALAGHVVTTHLIVSCSSARELLLNLVEASRLS